MTTMMFCPDWYAFWWTRWGPDGSNL